MDLRTADHLEAEKVLRVHSPTRMRRKMKILHKMQPVLFRCWLFISCKGGKKNPKRVSLVLGHGSPGRGSIRDPTSHKK